MQKKTTPKVGNIIITSFQMLNTGSLDEHFILLHMIFSHKSDHEQQHSTILPLTICSYSDSKIHTSQTQQILILVLFLMFNNIFIFQIKQFEKFRSTANCLNKERRSKSYEIRSNFRSTTTKFDNKSLFDNYIGFLAMKLTTLNTIAKPIVQINH